MLVLIPTYNEYENVGRIYKQISKLNLKIDILFIDDNSSDGTGKAVDRLAQSDPKVHVIHRPRKMGIGSAHLDGIRWAYDNHYKILVSMDCDFSHSPRDIKKFVKHSKDHDIVVGSRYLRKDSLKEWNLFRKILTHLGHFMTTKFLKMTYDASGAFRLYRLDKINRDCFDLVQSNSYSFFFESLYLFFLNNYSIKEFSIKLPARTYGHSKMSMADAFNSLLFLFKLYLRKTTKRKSFFCPGPFVFDRDLDSKKKQREWNQYWSKKKKTSSFIYDRIADFYRKNICRRILDLFINKHFKKNSYLLHAGCGSGEVDLNISKKMRITALDISKQALKLYKEKNKNRGQIIQGDILKIPFKRNCFDGVYNLGVLEHLSQREIDQALKEFYRVLKPKAKIIIFWPPKFGLSVIFLNSVHYIINNIFKKNIKLHPEEKSLLQSKKQAEIIFSQAGFKVLETYFGLRDLFTFVTIVGQKK